MLATFSIFEETSVPVTTVAIPICISTSKAVSFLFPGILAGICYYLLFPLGSGLGADFQTGLHIV